MAFQKKEWKNRLSEFPNRRRLEPTGIENTYDVVRAEGNVTETGDAFAEESMNDLEERIAAGIAESAVSTAERTTWNAAVPSTRKINNKALSADVTLAAADVGAVPTSDVATGAAANKILRMNSSGQLPATSTDTTSVASALTISTAAPTSTLAAGKLWGVY